jgi:hypothetical protein
VPFLGPIPESLSLLRSLKFLNLGGNALSGKVNISGTSPVMSLVYIASNFLRYFSFIGPIPASIGQLQSLTELHLYSNQLEGAWDITSDVPCVHCVYFSRYFSFSGPIPESIAQLQSLTELHLGSNQLEGAWDITSAVPCDFASIF